MQNWFTATIQSAKMQDLSLHTEVFNIAQIPEVICIKLPDSLPRDMELSGIFDLYANEDLEFQGYVARDEHRPWIDINTEILDLSVGDKVSIVGRFQSRTYYKKDSDQPMTAYEVSISDLTVIENVEKKEKENNGEEKE